MKRYGKWIAFLVWWAAYACFLWLRPMGWLTFLLGLPVCLWLTHWLHELGHLLDYWLDLRTNPEIIEPLRQAGPFYVQKNLSLYSVQNGYIDYAEAIAEGFSEARNNPKPRRLAQIIKATIDKSYQRKLMEIENQENQKYKKNSRIVWEKNK